ncbi:MAG TPA: ATP-binding protein [Chitinophagales bacterium]|nr:ATP-binding protein [Chitinophagales bacterium]
MLQQPVDVKTIKFSSKPENIAIVEKFIDDLRNEVNIGDDVYGNILISLTEAANNAIIHGNDSDESKQVEISYELDGRGKNLSFIIKDQGPGFDYNNLPDPTAPENLEKTSGRGVFLMMQLADMVVFSDKGATVEMQFRI